MPGLELRGEAFEVNAEGVRENLVIRSSDPMLGVGDPLPSIEGRTCRVAGEEAIDYDIASVIGPVVLSIVNACGTEICDKQTREMERLQDENPEVTFVSLSKQSPEDLDQFASENGLRMHELVSIDDETAVALGVALSADEGAPEVWNNMLLRAIIVGSFGPERKVLYVERVMDQMEQPNYEAALSAAFTP